MTPPATTQLSDLTEIADWIQGRWTTPTWTPQQRNAWWSEVGSLPIDLVWRALEQLKVSQPSWPPKPAEVAVLARRWVQPSSPSTAVSSPGGVSLADWLALHDWSGLSDAVTTEHAADCEICAELGVPTRVRLRSALPRCPVTGGEHVWGSCDRLDLDDGGMVTEWCACCGGERRIPVSVAKPARRAS